MHSKAPIVALSTFEIHCLEGKLTFGDPLLDSGVVGARDDLIPGDSRDADVSDAAAPRRREREVFIDNLLVRIHFIIVMIRWTGHTHTQGSNHTHKHTGYGTTTTTGCPRSRSAPRPTPTPAPSSSPEVSLSLYLSHTLSLSVSLPLSHTHCLSLSLTHTQGLLQLGSIQAHGRSPSTPTSESTLSS